WFATPKGAAMFWAFRALGEGLGTLHPRVPSMTQYLEMRHRAIELATRRWDPDVVVEIGAGLSRRGVTFAAEGVRYIEVDLPPMIAAKKRQLAALPSALRSQIPSLSLESVDVLSDAFEPWLRETLRDAARPVIIAEGVLGYFAMADRIRLAEVLARVLDGRGTFLSELRHQSGGNATAVGFLKAGIRLATRGRGAREDFESLSDVRSFFLDAGFRDARTLPPPPHLSHLQRPARVWEAT
ncbi:MAG: class I SAM-dependent methyltransferase, partial [Sandaracinaceae bacterium]